MRIPTTNLNGNMQGIYFFIHFAMKNMLGDDFAGNKKLLKNCRILMQALKLCCSFFEKNFNFEMSITLDEKTDLPL